MGPGSPSAHPRPGQGKWGGPGGVSEQVAERGPGRGRGFCVLARLSACVGILGCPLGLSRRHRASGGSGRMSAKGTHVLRLASADPPALVPAEVAVDERFRLMADHSPVLLWMAGSDA